MLDLAHAFVRSSERYGCIKGTVDEGGAAGAARGSMSGFVERAFSVSDSGVSGVGWGGPVPWGCVAAGGSVVAGLKLTFGAYG